MSAAAKPQEAMELAISIEGKIVKSNFDDFKAYAIEQIENINFEPETPDEFGQAKKDVANLDGFEKKLDVTESEILKQMEDVHALITGCRELKALSREKRLALNTAVKEQTAKVKKDIEDSAVASINTDNRERYRSKIVEAMKGKRTLDTLKKAANDKAAGINKCHEATNAIIDTFVNEHGNSIVPDASALVDMEPDALNEKLTERVKLAKAEEEKKAAEAKLAEAKRQEEEVGKTVLVNTGLEPGTPPKVDSISVGQQTESSGHRSSEDNASTERVMPGSGSDLSPQEEMEQFAGIVIAALGQLREPRKNLVHPENKTKAQAFADAALAAFNIMKGDSK